MMRHLAFAIAVAFSGALVAPAFAQQAAPQAAAQQTPEQVKLGLLYMDLEGRLDEQDILRQIAWYKEQGMLKGDVDGKSIIDSRYVVPMPAQ